MLARTTAAALVLAAAACAGEEPPPAPPPPAAVAAPGGMWVVTDAYPVAASYRDTPVVPGLRLRLDADEVTDALGRTCERPSWRSPGPMTAGEFLGGPARGAEFPELARPVQVAQAMCGDEAFGSYAQWPDGCLLSRQAGAMLRLERAETVRVPLPVAAMPVPMAAPVPLTPPASSPPAGGPPAAEAPPARPAAEGQPLQPVYLASYGSEKTAEKGWRTLSTRFPALAGLKPLMKPVDLGAKGRFVRLFAQAAPADAKTLCGKLRRALPDCGASGRD